MMKVYDLITKLPIWKVILFIEEEINKQGGPKNATCFLIDFKDLLRPVTIEKKGRHINPWGIDTVMVLCPTSYNHGEWAIEFTCCMECNRGLWNTPLVLLLKQAKGKGFYLSRVFNMKPGDKEMNIISGCDVNIYDTLGSFM